MPFCPKCRYEYREGIKICPDCEVKLVAELPKPSLTESELVVVASFMAAADAQMARLKLQASGIRSIVTGDVARGYVAATLIEANVKLLVCAEDASHARKILTED